AGRQSVRQSRFPRTRSGRRIDDDVALRFENSLDATQHTAAELLEFEPAVVEDLARHGRQDALRHRCRPRYLQEVSTRAARLVRHYCPQGSFCVVPSRVLVSYDAGYNWEKV